MRHPLIQVLKSAFAGGQTELVSAACAHRHYGAPAPSTIGRVYYWAIGFAEGLASGLRRLRVGDPAYPCFDSEETADLRFSSQQAGGRMEEILVIESAAYDTKGTAIQVTSTLSLAEVNKVVLGLNVLRGTGVFRLTDRQFDDFLQQAAAMNDRHARAELDRQINCAFNRANL